VTRKFSQNEKKKSQSRKNVTLAKDGLGKGLGLGRDGGREDKVKVTFSRLAGTGTMTRPG